MSYTVLARKYRSRTFDDLVGQDAIATTLKNAIIANRVHHGYLFTGTRGVGKTSSARVMAKALNCLSFDAPTPTPCCTCESCKMIAEGEDIDVIEIDAASNTGVDNIRDLRNNAAYRPARSRFKIYIIDEVHMLSTGAFNALLKTLEEPPDHVKFMLATTEIQKVPATIVSRCQRFDFKSISVDAISGHLGSILQAENIEAHEAVIRRIARLANGSMRDALSLLDQLLSFGAGELTTQTLDDVLPPAHDEVIAALLDCVAEQDAAGALRCVEQALSAGQTIERFCNITVEHLRTLMLLNICGAQTDLVDVASTVRDQLVEQSERFDSATFVYMIGLMEEVRRAVKASNASRALIDAAVVRLAQSTNFSNLETLIAQLEGGSDAGLAPSGKAAPSGDKAPSKASTPGKATSRPPSSSRRAASPTRVATTKATAKQAPPSRSKVSSADEAQVRKDPNVRQALELFEGTLVNVQRSSPNHGDEQPAPGTGQSEITGGPDAETDDGDS